jgi:DNA mismatch repair ATPase MutS
MWGTQWALRLERWRQRHGGALNAWLDAAGRWEALCSLAAYHAEHPDDVFPAVTDAPAHLHAAGLGHPLVDDSKCVRNDVALGPLPGLLMVSGSNMSGKSTYLRAIGVGTVMALMGCPVRARQMALCPLQVGACLRVQDSLAEGMSRFAAEIARLKQVVDLSIGPLPLLFLLDEILSGTNSHDRQAGAQAVLTGLLERGARGLVTTHDLALTTLATTLGTRVRNVHFRDEMKDGALSFDHRLHDGVVAHSNALELMRAVGLAV